MLKTREYLKSQFETGDIPIGEDYANLLDSYLHKGDLGNVGSGVENPVSGDAVYKAIQRAIARLDLETMVRRLLAEMLPELLREYVTAGAMQTALKSYATKSEMASAMDSKVGTGTLTELLAAKADVTALAPLALKTEMSAMKDDLTVQIGKRLLATDLEPRLSEYTKTSGLKAVLEKDGFVLNDTLVRNYATKSELPTLTNYALKSELPDMSTIALKTELPDTTVLATKAELTNYQTLVNTALQAKATQADVATAKQEAIDAAATNTSSVCALRTDFGDDGIYLRSAVLTP